MPFDKEKYVVRCSKCVIGNDKQGKPIGGVIAATGPGKGVCCACGCRYTIKVKPYAPDRFHEQNIDGVPF